MGEALVDFIIEPLSIAIIFSIFFGGWIVSRSLKERNIEEKEDWTNKYINSMNIENELMCKKADYERLCNEEENIARVKKFMKLLCGVCIPLIIALWESMIIKWVVVIVLIIAALELWECYLNSSSTVAIKYAKALGKRSVHREKQKCLEEINVIENIIEDRQNREFFRKNSY